MTEHLYIYSEENIAKQLNRENFQFGFYSVTFFTDSKGLPSTEETDQTAVFRLYTAGGTLRDKNFNIISYLAHFDTYRGFIPPHLVQES